MKFQVFFLFFKSKFIPKGITQIAQNFTIFGASERHFHAKPAHLEGIFMTSLPTWHETDIPQLSENEDEEAKMSLLKQVSV